MAGKMKRAAGLPAMTLSASVKRQINPIKDQIQAM
jgi:hypothetical protein